MSPAERLTREGLVLLLAAGADGPYPADAVRLMKGAFLVVERGRPEWKQLFDFEAYDYGPFDRRLYDARDELVRTGLLDVTPGRYEQYTVSAAGDQRVADLTKDLGSDAEWIRQIGHYVSTRSFSQLLGEIYSAYPEYQARSVFRR